MERVLRRSCQDGGRIEGIIMTLEEKSDNGQIPDIMDITEQHIDQLLSLMITETWYYYDYHELKRYLKMNEVCHVLQDEGGVIGSIFSTDYGNQAWIGNIVVKRSERKKGYGTEMIHSMITKHIQKGQDTFRLASVPEAIKFYQKPPYVFHAEYFTTAQQVALPLEMNIEQTELDGYVRQIELDDLETICHLDTQFFRSNRLGLFQQLYEDSIKKSCLCLEINGEIKGFLMLRRRGSSKQEGNFRDGPDHVYRIGPSCISPEYGMRGFEALFQKAIKHLNDQARNLAGDARVYIVFPRNAKKEEIYEDLTRRGKKPEEFFSGDEHVFETGRSKKNEDQWKYLERYGFEEEYYELVMSYVHNKDPTSSHHAWKGNETRANTEGIFASATPGDKA